MKKAISGIMPAILICFTWACTKEEIKKEVIQYEYPDTTIVSQNVRVPAEWETHQATWMQWALDWEASMRPAFADIIEVVKQYEPLHLIAISQKEKEEAIEFLQKEGVDQENITWHVHEIDNSWMRDNGPIYVTDGKKTWIQNWKFTGWGSGFGDIPWENDNQIPVKVAEYLGLKIEDRQDYVLEKGNVEVNGKGTLVINWDCQKDRNPNVSQEHQEIILKNALGVDKIIWAYGHYEGDGTIGHIDGTARFINENTIAIVNYGGELENNLAQACRDAGLDVIIFPGDMNWLAGNGFVLAMGEGNSNDELMKTELQKLWPDRDIHIIDGSDIMNLGGGIHCVTNDQPLL